MEGREKCYSFVLSRTLHGMSRANFNMLLFYFQITIYAGYAVLAFLASFAISMGFEAPAVRIIKIFSGGLRQKSQ
jgi:hypothetical protein